VTRKRTAVSAVLSWWVSKAKNLRLALLLAWREQSAEAASCSGLGGAESDGTRRITWRDRTGNKAAETSGFAGVNKSAVSADFSVVTERTKFLRLFLA
jgi:hypothetical protein